MNRASKKVFPPWHSEVRPGDGKPFKGLKKMVEEEVSADRTATIMALARKEGNPMPSKQSIEKALAEAKEEYDKKEAAFKKEHPFLKCECDKCYPMEAKMDDDSTLSN